MSLTTLSLTHGQCRCSFDDEDEDDPPPEADNAEAAAGTVVHSSEMPRRE